MKMHKKQGKKLSAVFLAGGDISEYNENKSNPFMRGVIFYAYL